MLMSPLRDVCLPLEKFDKCNICDEKSNLRLCSKCGETIYCSKKCQNKDWHRHRSACNLDRVDLAVLYPFLASLAEMGHCRQWQPFHPALTHQIVYPQNWPLSTVAPIILDDQIPEDEFTLEKWCPKLPTDGARRKLFQRILHESYTLPILMSISMALLAGIYTTKNVLAPSGNVRRGVRLMYRGSPISDFGIAKGSVNVQEQNRLGYFKETPFNVLFLRGQDPDEHYWLYFKTIRNEEAIVDLAASSFNLGSQVKVDPYIPGVFPMNSFAPALFQEDHDAKNGIGAHQERARFSVLRNDDLNAIASYATGYHVTPAETDDMWDFMNTVAGRKCQGIEKMIAIDLLQSALAQFESIVEERAWRQWPKPESRPCSDDAESSEWWRELMKWKKRNKSYLPQDPISLTSQFDDMFMTMHILRLS